MKQSRTDAVALQRSYYLATADSYDQAHALEPEHQLVLAWLCGVLDWQRAQSVLEVGCGTGRILSRLVDAVPDMRVYGVEPVAALIRRTPESLRHNERVSIFCGDGHFLPFADASIDYVCAFAVLHHVPEPEVLLAEMFRVARVGVVLSDNNNFGQGSKAVRLLKQGLNAFGLWRWFDWLRTGFRGYHVSEGDGLFYSFSMFRHLAFLRRKAHSVHLLNCNGDPSAAYRGAGHVGVIAFKRPMQDQ